VPAGVQGGVAGALAVFVTAKMIRRARYEAVAYAVASVVAAFTLLSLLFDLGMNGFTLTALIILTNGGAAAAGGYAVAQSEADARRISTVPAGA